MKLHTKTNLYSFIATLLLFSFGIFIVYHFILSRLDKEVDKQLLIIKSNIIKDLDKEGIDPNLMSSYRSYTFRIKQIPAQTIFHDQFTQYSDKKTNILDIGDEIPQRSLLFQTKSKNQSYEVNISVSLDERSRIGNDITTVVIIFILISTFVLFVINRFISSFIWSPFYDTLSKIKTWNIKKNEHLIFKQTDIDEFHLLNDTVKDLTQQIQVDYQHLKEFTENMSHEAQTPLSIISSKLELLMQETNYNEKQHKLLGQTYHATKRLYKLNEGLILLTRIENKQFAEINSINLASAIEEKIEVLEDFIEAKKISIVKNINCSSIKDVNPILLTILLNNLFINAIKYNLDKEGFIKITLDEDCFSIENTSSQDKIDRQMLFNRFNKNSISGSLGLGLSLIKKIVDFYNWQITYSYKEGIHKFKIYM